MKTVLSISLLALTPPVVQPATGAADQRPIQAKQQRSEPDAQRPLHWILAAQNENGGWGSEANAKPDVATTALAGIALLRLGYTPTAGAHSLATRKGLEFVARAVETTPDEVIDVNEDGTLPQRKLGRHIDTFLAAQFLAEAAKMMPPSTERERISAALQRCIAKIQRAQQQNGSFAADGWAPVLSSVFANTGLYAAQAAGAPVRAEVLRRAEGYMKSNYDSSAKNFKTSDSAGVALYSAVGTIRSAAESGRMKEEPAQAAVARLSDENFIRGFGTYGGEEHVSYMLTSEALAKVGGAAWEQWDRGIRSRLANIQRSDGTWRGDHCITSTAFCTAAALITLAVRSGPVQVRPG